MMTGGVGGLAAVNQDRLGLGIALSVLGGIGVGGLIQPAVTMLTIVSPDEAIATISAASISARLTGATIAYAIYFNILQSNLVVLPFNVRLAAVKAGLPESEAGGLAGAILSQNLTAVAAFPAPVVLAAQEAVIETYLPGFKAVFLTSISFGALAIIISFFVKDIKQYMVDRVAVTI